MGKKLQLTMIIGVLFFDVISSYNGSSDITSSNPAYKWLSKYWDKNYSSTMNNMKTTAYLMDINIWKNYYEDEYNTYMVDYAIGSPTAELYTASYNVMHPDKPLYAEAVTAGGYYFSRSLAGPYSVYISDIEITNDLYGLSNSADKAAGWWFSSPSPYDNNASFIPIKSCAIGYEGYLTATTCDGYIAIEPRWFKTNCLPIIFSQINRQWRWNI